MGRQILLGVDYAKAMQGRPCPECGGHHAGYREARLLMGGADPVLQLWCPMSNRWFPAPVVEDNTAEIETLMGARAEYIPVRRWRGRWIQSRVARVLR